MIRKPNELDLHPAWRVSE